MEDSLISKENFVGIDIGGTLAKICFTLKNDDPMIGKFEHIENLTSK